MQLHKDRRGVWMILADWWMDRHFGGKETRPVVIIHLANRWNRALTPLSTATNSTLIDQVVFLEMHLSMADRWKESILNDHRPHITDYCNPTTMLEWIKNRWTLGSKGTNGYYVVILPRMMQNAYLHYVWSVWLVAILVASTSWSFPIACIALVWRTREKGTEFFCTTRRTI